MQMTFFSKSSRHLPQKLKFFLDPAILKQKIPIVLISRAIWDFIAYPSGWCNWNNSVLSIGKNPRVFGTPYEIFAVKVFFAKIIISNSGKCGVKEND